MPPIDPNELPVGWQQPGVAPAPPPPDPGYKPYYVPKPQPFTGAKVMSLPPRQQQQQAAETVRLTLSQNADRRAEEQSQETLDPHTIEFYAQQVLSGAPMPAMGMGRQAAHSRALIMDKVSELADHAGLGGKDLATQQVHYRSAAKKISTLETQHGTTLQNEQTALLNGQQFMDRSQELPLQTGARGLNSIIQTAQRHIPGVPGGDTVSAMDTAWNTFITEYAKVVAGSPSGAGILSDSARHEAMDTLKGNYPLDQKTAAFEQMKKDMENRTKAQEEVLRRSYEDLTKQPDAIKETFTDYDVGNKQISTTSKTVKIPEGYQHDHEAMLAHHTPGTLTVGQYIQIRNSLDNKYEDQMGGNVHSHLDPADVRAFVNDYNKGGKHSKIPALNVPLSEEGVIPGTHLLSEKDRAGAAAGPLGTGLAAAANAGSFGVVEGVMGQENKDKLHMMEDANPKSAMAGEVIGSLPAMAGLERGGASLIEKLAPNLTVTARKKLLGDIAVNTAYGADRGFMGAKDGEGLQGAEAGAASGALATGAGNLATKGLTPLISDAASSAISKMKGVNMTTLQRLGLGKAEEGFSGVPLAHGARKKSLQSFNLDFANQGLKYIGGKLPKGIQPGTEVNAEVNKQLNAAYNEIRPQIVGAADGTFDNAITAIKTGAATKEKKAMYSEIKDALDKFKDPTTGHYDGQGYKEASERLRYLAKTWSNKEGDVAAGDMARAAEQARKQMQTLIQRQTPQVGARLKNIERAWAHSVLVEDASSRALASGEGVASPGQVLTSIKKLDTSTRKGASARGKAFGQPYAEAAAKTLGSGGVPKVSIRETTYVLAALGLGGAYHATAPIAATVTAMAAGAYGPGVKRVVQLALSGKRPTVIDNQLVRRALEDAMRHKMTGN